MSDIDRRKKMISLRLSDEEYEGLRTHYRAYGARNISELARLAVHRVITGTPQQDCLPEVARLALKQMMNELASQHDGFASKLTDLEERVQELESEVSLLSDREKVIR